MWVCLNVCMCVWLHSVVDWWNQHDSHWAFLMQKGADGVWPLAYSRFRGAFHALCWTVGAPVCLLACFSMLSAPFFPSFAAGTCLIKWFHNIPGLCACVLIVMNYTDGCFAVLNTRALLTIELHAIRQPAALHLWSDLSSWNPANTSVFLSFSGSGFCHFSLKTDQTFTGRTGQPLSQTVAVIGNKWACREKQNNSSSAQLAAPLSSDEFSMGLKRWNGNPCRNCKQDWELQILWISHANASNEANM